jgi:tight adherence protein B
VTRSVRRWIVVAGAFLGACLPAAASADELDVAPVARLPFPERGYVVGVPQSTGLEAARVSVRENGVRVPGVHVTPLSRSGLRFGVVLAVDASESMAGAPSIAALEAARAFVSHRKRGEELGLVAFNGDVDVLTPLTTDARRLADALSEPLELAYGTRIYDALDRSVFLLGRARVSAGSVVLLSDGADIGSVHSLDRVVASARRQRVRIFTIGLRSGAFEAGPLRAVAARTGGTYTEASSAAELAPIFDALGRRLATEYLVRYRSDARPESHVNVAIEIAGVGETVVGYTTPTPSRVDPFHRTFVSRFVRSSGSLALVALFFAALVGLALVLLARGPKRTHVARIGQFSGTGPQGKLERHAEALARALPAARYTHGWWARLERDLEIARIERSPRQIAAATVAASFLLVVVFVIASPILALLGLLAPPLIARAIIRWRLRRLREEFADALPAALQVLASALRAGHSFAGALGVMVENTHEPARSELRRVAHDEQLGVAPEVAIRRMADRMANRDLEQVALLAELQRTSGGNSAEVLDTVVETIRERGELRRLVRTLTAQGRMARWILTGLPIALALFLWVMQPEIMNPFLHSPFGQVLLFMAALMVAAGSVLIQRIVDIEV